VHHQGFASAASHEDGWQGVLCHSFFL